MSNLTPAAATEPHFLYPKTEGLYVSIYYQDDHVTLYHGDCLELTDWLDADVLVTDPPYGMSWQSGMRHKDDRLDLVAGDETTEARDRALDYWGHMKPWLMFGTWRVSPPDNEKQRLIWHKPDTPGMGDLRIPWGTAHEDIHLGGGLVGIVRKQTLRDLDQSSQLLLAHQVQVVLQA